MSKYGGTMREQRALHHFVGWVSVFLLFAQACGREPGILVNIAAWPDGVERIRVRTTIDNTVGSDIFLNKDQTRFVVRMPTGSQGTVQLDATGLDAMDCLLATGMLNEPVPDNLSRFVERTLDLSMLPARKCTFKLTPGSLVGVKPSAVAVGDFNGDQISDLVITSDVVNGSVYLLWGKGSGDFVSHSQTPVGARPGSIAVGDFDGDTRPDVAVTNFWGGTISVLLSDGMGGLLKAPPPKSDFGSGGMLPNSVAVGDFDRDSKLDLVVTNSELAGKVSVLLAAGAFSSPQLFTTGRSPSSVAVGDLNRDGFLDLAVANLWNQPGTEVYTVSVLLNNGKGDFNSAIDRPVGTNPVSVAVGDFNGDTMLDLAVANLGSNDVSVLLGGDFSSISKVSVGMEPYSIVVADFNGDLKADLAVVNSKSNDVSVLLGDGQGGFGPATNFQVGKHPTAVAVGDFNGDKWPDLAVTNYDDDSFSILLNQFKLTQPQR